MNGQNIGMRTQAKAVIIVQVLASTALSGNPGSTTEFVDLDFLSICRFNVSLCSLRTGH